MAGDRAAADRRGAPRAERRRDRRRRPFWRHSLVISPSCAGVRVAPRRAVRRAGVRLVTARGRARGAGWWSTAAGAWAGEADRRAAAGPRSSATCTCWRAAGAGAPVPVAPRRRRDVCPRRTQPASWSRRAMRPSRAAADQQPDAAGEGRGCRRALVGSAWSRSSIARRWACQRAFTTGPQRCASGANPPRGPGWSGRPGSAVMGRRRSAAVGEVVADACLAALR